MRYKVSIIWSCSAALCVMLCAVLWIGTGEVYAAGEYKVIINSEVGVDAISAGDFESVLLGNKKKWDDGSKVYIAVLKEGDITETFLKTHTKKTPSQFKTYWKKLVFTGKGIEPKSLGSEEDMVAYVAKTKGAVGYVSADASMDGVKELTIN